MKRLSKHHARLSLVLLVAGSACFKNTPIGLGIPAPETRIIASVTDVGSDHMAKLIGVAATEVEGIVESATDSVWNLRVIRVDQRGGASTMWNRELVSFPRWALTSPSAKKIDKKRSWLFAGMIAATAFLAERLIIGAFSLDDAGRGPPEVPPT
ncbi:MAG TPA: hypothetical protein VKH19_15305 [Gemmatimonadaceae bacterium]|nr:hypothetical protein [Gemmatimonadaceae bacterium]